MSEQQNSNTAPQPVLTCLGFGLFCIAIVPGIGWMWGQFWETVVLVIGIGFLVYVAFAYISSVNSRLAALEQRLADKDRTRS